MAALLLPMVIGMMGLTVDVGIWYAEKRGLQDTADAASLAGGSESANGSSDATIIAAALADANRNDFDGTTDTIAVNIPPKSGPNITSLDSVEVIITRQMPLFFITAFFKCSSPRRFSS
jgi:Flp pilus assembly protein TadG